MTGQKHHTLIAFTFIVGLFVPCIAYSQISAYGFYDPKSYGGGITYIPHQTSLVMGVDVGTDGVLRKIDHLDNYHEEDNWVGRLTPGLHINLENRRGGPGMTIMGMFGARRTKVKCPTGTNFSYLGFPCYADVDVVYDWGFAWGFMAMFHYKATIGFRITDTINTIVLGYHF